MVATGSIAQVSVEAKSFAVPKPTPSEIQAGNAYADLSRPPSPQRGRPGPLRDKRDSEHAHHHPCGYFRQVRPLKIYAMTWNAFKSHDESDTTTTGVQAERNIKGQRQRDLTAMARDQLLHDEALKHDPHDPNQGDPQ
jgi:hypothetical protein